MKRRNEPAIARPRWKMQVFLRERSWCLPLSDDLPVFVLHRFSQKLIYTPVSTYQSCPDSSGYAKARPRPKMEVSGGYKPYIALTES